MRQNAQLLVDDGDSRRLRLLGRPQLTDMAGEADFSGMDGHENWLYISAVVHKALVDVNEEGTEAAAATAVIAVPLGGEEPGPSFIADHPFVFLIRDNHTGSVLFLGRVVDPSK